MWLDRAPQDPIDIKFSSTGATDMATRATGSRSRVDSGCATLERAAMTDAPKGPANPATADGSSKNPKRSATNRRLDRPPTRQPDAQPAEMASPLSPTLAAGRSGAYACTVLLMPGHPAALPPTALPMLIYPRSKVKKK